VLSSTTAGPSADARFVGPGIGLANSRRVNVSLIAEEQAVHPSVSFRHLDPWEAAQGPPVRVVAAASQSTSTRSPEPYASPTRAVRGIRARPVRSPCWT